MSDCVFRDQYSKQWMVRLELTADQADAVADGLGPHDSAGAYIREFADRARKWNTDE